MITGLTIHNFKCFSQLPLTLAPLTLLSGLNSTGKSTVLQTLLLLRQSHGRKELRLNGSLVELGHPVDVFFQEAKDQVLAFELITSEGDSYRWEYVFDPMQDLFTPKKAPKSVKHVSLFNDHFHYLGAERWGPRVFTPLSEDDIRHHNLGKQGEYAIHYLVAYGDKKLPNPDIPTHSDQSSRTLLSQVQAWLGEISPGTRIETNAITKADIGTLSYLFTHKEFGVSGPFRPTNVAFGLSYTLPVIIALLSLPKGGLVLLENPEAHLHPRGQSFIGRLIAQVAAAGNHVIVETHSDHILNGVRIAVRMGLIKPELTQIHYFNRIDNTIEILTPKMNAEGRIDIWPKGFFDEAVRNLSALTATSSQSTE